jgi:xylulokinase
MDVPSAERYVLAIDLGSGGPKAGLVSLDGRLVSCAHASTGWYFLPGGGAEQDPEEWWTAVSQVSRRVVRSAHVPSESILAVCCTGQWAVTVAVDRHGQPLMNALSWMDTRGGRYNRDLMRGFPSVQGYGMAKLLRWIRLSGAPPTLSGIDALAHILYIQHERPQVYRQTDKFLEPVDYINLRLTGRCAATQNTAFPYMLVDNRRLDRLDYHPGLLQAAGLDRAKLPDLLPAGSVLGPVLPSIAADWGLAPDTPVVVGATDNSTSAVGSGAIHDFDAVAVLGSSGFLACHAPFKKTDLIHMLACMPSALPGRYLVFAELGNSGKVIDTFLYNLVYCQDGFAGGELPDDVYTRLEQVAGQAPPGSDGTLCLPWFNGSMAPQEDPYVRGGFLNLSHTTTRAHLARSVLEGVAFNWRWLRAPLEKFIGRRFTSWRLAGGGAQSPLWAQIMADVIGLPIHRVANPRYGNVLGAAFLAFHYLGLLALKDIPGKVEIAQVYEPRQECQPLYDHLYRQFLAAYRQLRPIYHAMNKG